MSDLHEFEADFLRGLIAARREGRELIYGSDWTPSQEIGAEDKRMADDLKKRGLVAISYGCGQWNTVVVITDKGYSALAEHIADERIPDLYTLRYLKGDEGALESMLDLLRDQAKRIAELELRA